MITLRDLSLRVGEHLLLDRVNAVLAPACIAVIGANGAGKSSLLHLCADGGRHHQGITRADDLLLDGRPMLEWPVATLARRRAFLPQQHAQALPLPVPAILDLATWPHGGGPLPSALREAAIERWELAPLLDRTYTALSGGERQRVQLARTWLQMRLHATPGERLWLLDEPQSALDLPHQQVLLDVLREEAASGALVMFSTHDLNFALRAADRILGLKAGRLLADVTPAELADATLLQELFGVAFVQLPHPRDGRPLLLPE